LAKNAYSALKVQFRGFRRHTLRNKIRIIGVLKAKKSDNMISRSDTYESVTDEWRDEQRGWRIAISLYNNIAP